MPTANQPPHTDLTYQIDGAAMTVHNMLRPGHEEAAYQKLLNSARGGPSLLVAADLGRVKRACAPRQTKTYATTRSATLPDLPLVLLRKSAWVVAGP